MRKEYSDLPPDQRITHMKRGVVNFLFMFTLMVIVVATFLSLLTYHGSLIEDNTTTTNSTTLEVIDTEETVGPPDTFLVLLVIGMLVSVFGIIEIGDSLGTWAANKLNLYTDLHLEAAERRVAEIKKALTFSKTSKPEDGKHE